MIDQNVYHLCHVGSLKIRTSPLTTWFVQNARKEICYFCLWMKWNEGAHGRKSFLESLNEKYGPNVIAGLWKDNRKIQETQTSVTSNTEAEQER